jgi:hypothetical protein
VSRRISLAALALVCISCSRPVEPSPATASASGKLRAEETSHALVTLELTSKGLRVLRETIVEQSLPRLRVPEPHPWLLELKTADGETLYETRIPPQDLVRGEFDEKSTGTISGSFVPVERAVFQVRVPLQSGLLRLTDTRGVEPKLLGAVELAR